MDQKVAKSAKLSHEIARVVRQRIRKRNKEIKQALVETKKMLQTDSLESDNDIEEEAKKHDEYEAFNSPVNGSAEHQQNS